MAKIKRGDMEGFKTWLVSEGASILKTRNPYEALRFTSRAGDGVVFHGKDQLSPSNQIVQEAFDCYKENKPWTGKKGKREKSPSYKTHKFYLMQRDGHECFYCGESFPQNKLTQEHLVAISVGGPDNLENKVLACAECNETADSMSVMEKVQMREKLHAEKAEREKEEARILMTWLEENIE